MKEDDQIALVIVKLGKAILYLNIKPQNYLLGMLKILMVSILFWTEREKQGKYYGKKLLLPYMCHNKLIMDGNLCFMQFFSPLLTLLLSQNML